MSRVAGLDPARVRVIAPDVGGGFGVKGVLYPEDLLVGLLALWTGRPVKWIEDRAEHLRSAIHAREQVHEVELGMTRDGEEELTYDQEGQLTSGTLADYLVPTAGEVPRIDLEHMETPSPLNPLGLKGVGEGGAIPGPAAIANAVEHALRGSGSGLGKRDPVIRRTPLSPAHVRSLIEG